MSPKLSFAFKVTLASILLAVAIKNIAPQLAIPATSGSALALVLTPPLGMLCILLVRLWLKTPSAAAIDRPAKRP